jgi:ferritin
MDPKIIEAFTKQSCLEAGNAVGYLNAYAWLRAEGWVGLSKQYKNAAQEELGHAQNWVKHMARFDVAIKVVPAIVDIPTETPEGLVRAAADIEQETEDSMRAVIKIAEEVGDAEIVEWASGKLVEQSHDTKVARDFAKYIEKAAREPGTLVIIDRKLERNEF